MALLPAQVQEMRRQEIIEFCREWQAHLNLLDGKVDENWLHIARSAVSPANFGYEQGQLRPNRELARFDLYGLLVPAPGVPDALLICQLTTRQVQDAFNENDPEYISELDELFGETDSPAIRLALLELGMLELGIPLTETL